MHISVKFKREYSNYEAIMSTYVLPLAFRRIPLGSRYWMRGDFNYLQVWCVVFSKISCRRTDRKMERIAKIIVPMSFKRKEQLMGVKDGDDVYFVYFKVKGIYFFMRKIHGVRCLCMTSLVQNILLGMNGKLFWVYCKNEIKLITLKFF